MNVSVVCQNGQPVFRLFWLLSSFPGSVWPQPFFPSPGPILGLYVAMVMINKAAVNSLYFMRRWDWVESRIGPGLNPDP